MSKSDEFRQYAEEAMRWARNSKTEKDQAALIDIARTWTIAATYRETHTEERAAWGPPQFGGFPSREPTTGFRGRRPRSAPPI
jgi:hypothetical protein